MGPSDHRAWNAPSSVSQATKRLFGSWQRIGLLVGAVAVVAIGCRLSLPDVQLNSIDIRGVVVSAEGQPVDGILVRVENSGISGRSGADGQFLLEDLPRREIDLEIEAASVSSVALGAFESSAGNHVTIQLDKAGGAGNVQVLRGQSFCITNQLVRPASASNPDARGKIQVEATSTYQIFSLDVLRMRENQNHEVWLQADPKNHNSMRSIGVLRTHGPANSNPMDGEGQLAFVAEGTTSTATLPLGLPLVELLGRRIEVRDTQQGAILLSGVVPTLSDYEGPSDVERDDLVRVGGPETGRGSVRVKGTPDCSRDNFWVQIKGLESLTNYEICIACDGVSKMNGGTEASPRVAGTPAFILSNVTATAGNEILIPVQLDTNGETITFAQFVVNYDPSVLTFLSVLPGSGTSSGWTITPNPTPFSMAPGQLLVQFTGNCVPMVGCSTFNGLVEIAKLRFQVSGSATGLSCLTFDPCDLSNCVPAGRRHTTVTLQSGVSLDGAAGLTLDDGCVTIQQFDCFQVTTSQGGEAHLFLNVKQCDTLPCGVSCVRDLGGAAIEVRQEDGTVVLEGTVPSVN